MAGRAQWCEPVAGPFGPRQVTRRVALGGTLAAAAGLAAGCAIGGSDSPGDSGTDGAGPESAQAVIALAAVPVGGATAVSIGGRPAIVARSAERTVTAHSARCTHQGCTVFVRGQILQCPCHGSQFDPLTGAVLRGPAAEPLPAIPVRVDGDEVVAG